LLEVGIPITKLKNPKFVTLIEKEHPSLSGLSAVRVVQPLIRSMVLDSVKAAMAERLVAITFDGSKVNFSIEGMLARFLNADFMPTSLCVGVKVLATSLMAVTMRTLIRKHARVFECGKHAAEGAHASQEVHEWVQDDGQRVASWARNVYAAHTAVMPRRV
jgi:hypothetical protein